MVDLASIQGDHGKVELHKKISHAIANKLISLFLLGNATCHQHFTKHCRFLTFFEFSSISSVGRG